MALKVWLNGSMKKIDTNLHKPVTFISGDKYVLDKAWVFVNGVKHNIWGESGMQIDYISSTGSLGGGNIFAIGENWVDCTYNKQVYRIDISNLSNPTLIQNVAWGNIVVYNGYQSISGSMVFYNCEYTSGVYTSNKMFMNPVNGTITIGRSKNDSHTYFGDTDSYLITTEARTKTFSSPIRVSATYGTKFYWDGVLKYSTGREPSSMGNLNANTLKISGSPIQIDQDSIIFNMVGSYGTGAGLYLGTDTTYSRLTGIRLGNLMYDDNAITQEHYNGSATFVSGTEPKTALSLLDKTSYAETNIFDTDFDNTGKILKFLGRVGNYYYVITMPNNSNDTSGVKIIALNKADLSVAFSRDLPADPFGENNGTVAYWYNCSTVPQVSQTGFVGVSTYNANTLGLRIVRFSAIF